MANPNMTPETIEAARRRIHAAWEAKEWGRLRDIVRNPDNKVSRGALAIYGAPAVRATIKEWLTWLDTASAGESERIAAEARANRAAEWDARMERARREAVHYDATHGPAWNNNGETYPHALAFLEAKLAQGFKTEQTGIGTWRLRNAETGVFIGPLRNKYLNAAIAYKASEPASKES